MDDQKSKEFILREVSDFYNKTEKPILLSQLGQFFKDHFDMSPSRYFGGTTLGAFIKQYMVNELTMISSPKSQLTVYVVPVGMAEVWKKFMEEKFQPSVAAIDVSHQRNTSIPYDQIKKSILHAFSRMVPVDVNRYIKNVYPFDYKHWTETEFETRDTNEKIQWTKLDAESISMISQPDRIWEMITTWRQHNNISENDILIKNSKSATALANQHGGTTFDQKVCAALFLRLLDSQPDDIKERIVVPADIVIKLFSVTR